MKFGKFDLISLHDGFVAIDGGGVFGAVPRAIWQRHFSPDDGNLIRLAMRPLLVKTGREIVLIDTGVGDKFPPDKAKQWGLDRSTTLLDNLVEHDLRPEDITIVILTHLHFDHCGGATRFTDDGRIVPTFPNARYVVNRTEWQTAHNPDPRSRSSYFPDNFEPLRSQLQFVDSQGFITMGIKTLQTGGHTKGHMSVLIESDGQKAIFWADILPTTAHLKPTWPMGFDLYPLETMEMKTKLLKQALAERWLSIFNHDPHTPMGYIHGNLQQLSVQAVDAL